MALRETVKKMKDAISKAGTTGVVREVEFTFSAPEAKKVCIAGTFNAWNTKSIPMKKDKGGTWRSTVKLSPGMYEYKYCVDGAWAQDIRGAEVVPNAFGTYNSVIRVE